MASPVNPIPLPSEVPLIQLRDKKKYPNPNEKDPKEGFIHQRWQEYLDREGANLAAASTRINSVDLEDQSASIPATDLSDGDLTSGLYEVLIYASPVVAGDASSSLRVDIDVVDNGQTKTITGTAIVGNSTGRVLYDVIPIHIDNASPVRYTVTYAAGGGTAMKFDLRLILRRVDA